MPSPDQIRTLVTTYLERMNNDDIDGIIDLFAEDATAEDPVGGDVKEGKEALRAFYGMAAPALQVELKGPICVAGNSCAFLLLAELSTPDGKNYLDATDVFTFNDDGLVTSMRAYWSPAEMRQQP